MLTPEQLKKIKSSLEQLGAEPDVIALVDQEIVDVQDNHMLAYELLGVIIDVEDGPGFDEVCLNTVKRVQQKLSEK